MPPNSLINLSISLLLIIQTFLIRRNQITTEIRLRRLRCAALAALARHRQVLSEKMKMMPRLCIYIYKNVHIHLFHTVSILNILMESPLYTYNHTNSHLNVLLCHKWLVLMFVSHPAKNFNPSIKNKLYLKLFKFVHTCEPSNNGDILLKWL